MVVVESGWFLLSSAHLYFGFLWTCICITIRKCQHLPHSFCPKPFTPTVLGFPSCASWTLTKAPPLASLQPQSCLVSPADPSFTLTQLCDPCSLKKCSVLPIIRAPHGLSLVRQTRYPLPDAMLLQNGSNRHPRRQWTLPFGAAHSLVLLRTRPAGTQTPCCSLGWTPD